MTTTDCHLGATATLLSCHNTLLFVSPPPQCCCAVPLLFCVCVCLVQKCNCGAVQDRWRDARWLRLLRRPRRSQPMGTTHCVVVTGAALTNSVCSTIVRRCVSCMCDGVPAECEMWWRTVALAGGGNGRAIALFSTLVVTLDLNIAQVCNQPCLAICLNSCLTLLLMGVRVCNKPYHRSCMCHGMV